MYPSVTQILRPLFEATYGPITDGSKQYLDRGTYVGQAMDMLVQRKEINPAWLAWFNTHADWVPYLDAGVKYLAEHPNISPVCQAEFMSANDKFVGHPDWLWPEHHRVIDIKTGSGEPPAWLALQTAAYARLYWIGTGYKLSRALLWLRPDGDYRIIEHTNPHDEQDFLDLLKAWWIVKGRLA